MPKLQRFEDPLILIIKNILIIILVICSLIFFACLSLYMSYRYQQADYIKAAFRQMTSINQYIFLPIKLNDPVIQYTQQDVSIRKFITIYRLDTSTTSQIKAQFLTKPSLFFENKMFNCINPTIKTRWRFPYLTFHYVHPPEMFKHHYDYKVHDSFIVYGTNKYIRQIEAICTEPQSLYIYQDQQQLLRTLESFNQPHNIHFNEVDIRLNSQEKLLFIEMTLTK